MRLIVMSMRLPALTLPAGHAPAWLRSPRHDCLMSCAWTDVETIERACRCRPSFGSLSQYGAAFVRRVQQARLSLRSVSPCGAQSAWGRFFYYDISSSLVALSKQPSVATQVHHPEFLMAYGFAGRGGNRSVVKHTRMSTPVGPRHRTVRVNEGFKMGSVHVALGGCSL
jgi:hypothetical protein